MSVSWSWELGLQGEQGGRLEWKIRVISWNGGKEEERVLTAKQVCCGDGGIGWGVEKGDKDTVSLPASLAGALCRFSGNALLELGAGIKHSQY